MMDTMTDILTPILASERVWQEIGADRLPDASLRKLRWIQQCDLPSEFTSTDRQTERTNTTES